MLQYKILRRLVGAVRRSSKESCGDIAHWFFSGTTRSYIPHFKCLVVQQGKTALPRIMHPALLTWLQLACGCFQDSRMYWKQSVSRASRTLNHLWGPTDISVQDFKNCFEQRPKRKDRCREFETDFLENCGLLIRTCSSQNNFFQKLVSKLFAILLWRGLFCWPKQWV
jgi:hypothetical protein